MATGVDLSNIDWDGMAAKCAQHERALDERVIEKRDESAAAALVAIYASGARMSAPELQAIMDEGSRQVMREVVERSTIPGASATVNPLNYFGLSDKTGPKAATNTALINLRRSLEIWLTEEDMRTALTKEHGSSGKKRTRTAKNLERLEQGEWADSIGEVEHALVRYLCDKKFKGAEEDVARAYVRESFHWIPWNKPEDPVIYPASW